MDDDIPKLLFRREALERGFDDAELRRARTSGEFVPVRRGVLVRADDYARANEDLRHRLAVEAAVAASRTDAVVSHVSAAVVHGLSLWDVPLRRVHLTLDARSGGRIGTRRHVHVAPLDDLDVTVVDGLAVTSVARTQSSIAPARCHSRRRSSLAIPLCTAGSCRLRICVLLSMRPVVARVRGRLREQSNSWTAEANRRANREAAS